MPYSVVGQNLTLEQQANTNRTLHIGYVVYEGFTPLDIWGPMELLFQLSNARNMTLSVVSHKKGPVNARSPPHHSGHDPEIGAADYSHMINPQIIATHTFEDAPHLDVIVVPGGAGYFHLIEEANNTILEDFLARRAREADYLVSVCIGSVAFARAGLLAGRRATTNKAAWTWATNPNHGSNITWVPSARWVQDGNIWTSSGVAAGIDMMWAFLRHLYGPILDKLVNSIEYAPHRDPDWDPFSVVFNVPGASQNQTLSKDCDAPLPT
ncbi:class I glutamine amidotransferase-like protein [Tricladium varicosporioides]|nr:class I glutamine amidotransferase-like protein [Hymenoscyphus varicosporioides]